MNCPHGPWHHQFSEVALMETKPLKNSQADSQSRANFIVTPFYNYAMPLIRYANGDLVELAEAPCPCGRTLPRIERIWGRERNMFTFSDGSQVRPDMSRNDYEPFLSAKQFQIIQHTATQIEVFYVADNAEQFVDLHGLTQLMQKILHHDIQVKVTQVEQISRSASGKYETWKNNISQQV